jgi:hypothetical protein
MKDVVRASLSELEKEYEARRRWIPVASDFDDEGYTERLGIPGGWLYRTRIYEEGGPSVAMVFVPDPPGGAQ